MNAAKKSEMSIKGTEWAKIEVKASDFLKWTLQEI